MTIFVPFALAICCVSVDPVRFEAASFGRRPSFTGIGDLPGGDFHSFVYAVSADGTTVVGRSISAPPSGSNQPYEAFRWTASEGIVGLGDRNGGVIQSEAYDVSANGGVIVGETDSGEFRWTMLGGMVGLTGPMDELPNIHPRGISADGSIVVGFSSPATGGTTASRWSAATGIVNLGALPNNLTVPDAFLTNVSGDGNTATGNSFATDGVHPLRWTLNDGLVGLGDVPGGIFYALGEGVSSDGTTLVGCARVVSGVESRDEAWLWRAGRGFTLLDPNHAADFTSIAYACSGDGSVIVGYFGGVTNGAMIWDESTGMRSIREILEIENGLDLTGWTLLTARDVSADGTVVVGTGINPNGDLEGWVATIPREIIEPVPALSCSGVVVLVLSLLLCGGLVLVRRAGHASRSMD